MVDQAGETSVTPVVPQTQARSSTCFKHQSSMSPAVIHTFSADPARNPHARYEAALTLARSGFPVAQIEVGGKRPLGGWKRATTDYEAVRDRWFDKPDANVGVAAESGRVWLDIDERHGGSLERAAETGLPIEGFRYRTPGGWRVPLLMPQGVRAVRSAQIVDGVEVIGPGKGVVVPHSIVGGRWYGVEPDRNIWQWDEIPEQWEHLRQLTTSTLAASGTIEAATAEDYETARDIIDALLKSENRQRVTWILGGEFQRAGYPSRSEADAALAFMATHHLRGNERASSVLFALLEQHSRKAKTHPTPAQYLRTQVQNTMSHRERKDQARLATLQSLLIGCLQDTYPRSVTDPKDVPSRGKKAALVVAVVAFAARIGPDDYAQHDGWRRIPVGDFASLFETSSENVRLALKDAEGQGLIERRVPAYSHDGKVRRDSLVRLVRSEGELIPPQTAVTPREYEAAASCLS